MYYTIAELDDQGVEEAQGFRERFLSNELHHDLEYINWCNVNYTDKASEKYYSCLSNADGDNTGM